MKSESSSCHGVAFELPNNRQKRVLNYIMAREVKDFRLHELLIRLDQGDEVIATVATYEGKGLDPSEEIDHIAKMVLKASGRDGPCIQYLKSIRSELQRLGIDDLAVRELWGAVAQSHSQLA
jgi:cation transport regulator ChaC